MVEITNTRCPRTMERFMEYMNEHHVDTFHMETDDLFWGTADGNYIKYTEMTDQHLSNVAHLFEDDIPHQINKEIKRRNLEILPYKPYYDDELENKICGGWIK